jgi:hypothetical protein
MSGDTEKGFDEINMQYIKRVQGAPCGLQNSRFAYLRNIHPTYTIIARVQERTNLDTGPSSREFDVELRPNPSLDYAAPNELDVYLGCPIPGPTLQLFEWTVTGARRKP